MHFQKSSNNDIPIIAPAAAYLKQEKTTSRDQLAAAVSKK